MKGRNSHGSVLTDLKNRGVQDIFIACVDGLTGFPDAIAATYPFSFGGKSSYRNDSEKWDDQYPTISRSWKRHWVNIIPMFSFPPEIRRVMYTTNAIESLNMTLPKVTKNHRVLANDEAVLKVIYLAIGNLSKKWTMPIKDWKPALNRFAIEFEGRLPREICP
jgi:putative transposase